MGRDAERTQAATVPTKAFAVPASTSNAFAQDILALALVAIAAGSLLWRMARSLRGFLAAGRTGMPGDPTTSGSGVGNAAWSGGCGGGCSGCSNNAVRVASPTASLESNIVSITALTLNDTALEPRRSNYSTQ